MLAWILFGVFAVASIVWAKICGYQRTIRKIHLKYNVPMERLYTVFPKWYMIFSYFAMLRWAIVIVLFFIDWKIALLCIAFGAALLLAYTLFFDGRDYQHLQRAKRVLSKRGWQEQYLNTYIDMAIGETL